MQKITTYLTQRWVYFILILLSFVLYGNSIRNGYGLDDEFVVTQNPLVQKGLSATWQILEMPYARIGNMTLDRRPVTLLTFAAEHQFIGNNPHASHLINVLLYALCLIVLYVVLINVFHLDETHPWLPFIITLFFAVHPLHTEVVDSLKNRDEELVLLFGLLFVLYGYYYYTKESKRWLYVLLSFFFLLLTLLSKITGLVFVGVFILLCFYNSFFKGKIWNYWYIILCLRSVYKVALRAFESIKNRETTVFENPLALNKNMLVSLATACRILVYHIKMLLFPAPLRFYYGYNMFPVNTLANPVAFISFIVHGALLVYGAIRFYKKDNLGLFILCYFVSIALYSNFPAPYTGMFSERALLLSSLWFIIIIAVVAVRLWNKYEAVLQRPALKGFFMAVLTMVFVLYSFMTISRNFLWKDNLVLMSHDIEYMDNSVLGNYMYANNLKRASKEATDSAISLELANKAVYYFRHTIYLQPNYPEFYFKLGSTYRYNLNNLDSAEANFGYAISIDSLYKDANFELSKLFFDKGNFKNSYYFFGKTYSIAPKDSLTLFYYAQAASNVGDMATCYKINREFLKQYPKLVYPYMNLGAYYGKISKDDSAVIYFEKAIELGERQPQLLQQMSAYYKEKNDEAKATYYLNLLKEKR